jgi:hypothetical protein
LFAALVGIHGESVLSVSESVPAKSVCDIVGNPEHFAEKKVLVRALFLSDGIESQELTDLACKEKGINVTVVRHAKGWDELDADLHKGALGTVDKTITATFSGIFHWHPREFRGYTLVVEEITAIEVEPGINRTLRNDKQTR